MTGGGDRFGLSGWRVGAAGSGATAAALDDAVEHATTAEGELALAVEAIETAERALQAARSAAAELPLRLDTNEAPSRAASSRLAPPA